MELVLASTSPYRRALLERIGLPFQAVAPAVDEIGLQGAGLPPVELARELARAKARAGAAACPGAVVIGSDQVCALDDEVLSKPGSAERAVDQLLRLQGRAHELLTAVCVCHPGGEEEFLDRTVLHMRALDRAALSRYVDADQPLDCAGAYKLEAGGIALFEQIESDDHSAVTGLPLMTLIAVLTRLGLAIP